MLLAVGIMNFEWSLLGCSDDFVIRKWILIHVLLGCCRFVGSAGQSFGCFMCRGMNVRLVGEGNDYVGKVSRNKLEGDSVESCHQVERDVIGGHDNHLEQLQKILGVGQSDSLSLDIHLL